MDDPADPPTTLGLPEGTTPPRRTTRLARGALVGRYVVVEFLDRGGMGEVYKAFDPELDRPLAIKLVAHERTTDPERAHTLQQRLVREAHALARLSHPNVVAIHDVGPHADGVFIAMEFVPGRSLKAYLADGPHPRDQVLPRLVAAAEGLAAAHRVGIVHRDVKPGNILLGDDGRVRLIDFGIARTGGEVAAPALDHSGDDLTEVGHRVGTPRYMAPEQHAGGDASPRSDQFAFAAVAFEALYGAHPFPGRDRAEVIARIRAGAVTIPADHAVPPWLGAVLARGLAVDPAARFPSMDALVAALRHDPEAEAAQRRARRLRTGLAAIAAASLAVAGWAVTRRAPSQAASPACPDATPRLAGAWDDAVRARVRERFAAVAAPYARDTYPRVAAVLDRHAAAWVAAHHDACEATHVRHEQSPAVLDRRMQCLDQRLAQLRALAHLFTEADAAVVDQAVAAAAKLDAAQSCADVVALTGRVAPPPDAATAAAARAARAALADAQAAFLAGRYQAARDALLALRDHSATLRDPATRGAIADLLSQAEQRTSHPDAALASGYAAAALAQESGDDGLQVDALGDVMIVLALDLGRLADAEVFGDLAEATLRRIGSPGEARFRYLHRRGMAYLANGDARAGSYLEDAYRLGAALYGREHPEVARVLSNLGMVRLRGHDATGAQAAFRDAYEIFARTLGPTHPTVGVAHNNVGVAAWELHDLPTARREYEAGLAIALTTLGPDHPRVATMHANLGEVELALGDAAAARAAYQRGVDIWSRADSPPAPDLAEALVGLGKSAATLGDTAAARAAFTRAVAICGVDACAGDDARLLAEARAGLTPR